VSSVVGAFTVIVRVNVLSSGVPPGGGAVTCPVDGVAIIGTVLLSLTLDKDVVDWFLMIGTVPVSCASTGWGRVAPTATSIVAQTSEILKKDIVFTQ
jgi:hypothetical protein